MPQYLQIIIDNPLCFFVGGLELPMATLLSFHTLELPLCAAVKNHTIKHDPHSPFRASRPHFYQHSPVGYGYSALLPGFLTAVVTAPIPCGLPVPFLMTSWGLCPASVEWWHSFACGRVRIRTSAPAKTYAARCSIYASFPPVCQQVLPAGLSSFW